MKKLITSLAGIFVLVASCSSAQAQNAPLDRLYPGYETTVMSSEADVRQMFTNMPNTFRMGSFMTPASQCFERAEVWTYDLYVNHQVNSMKTFLFFTHAFKEAYQAMFGKKFKWWFHVTPYVVAQNSSRTGVQEWALDPTFEVAPLSLQDWSQIFIDTKKKCAEFVPYEDFKNEVMDGPDAITGTEHCYLVRVPATVFDPNGVEAQALGQTPNFEWNMDDVKVSANDAPTIWTRAKIKKLLGLTD